MTNFNLRLPIATMGGGRDDPHSLADSLASVSPDPNCHIQGTKWTQVSDGTILFCQLKFLSLQKPGSIHIWTCEIQGYSRLLTNKIQDCFNDICTFKGSKMIKFKTFQDYFVKFKIFKALYVRTLKNSIPTVPCRINYNSKLSIPIEKILMKELI